ncbi:MAG: hypothetical protein KGL98_10370 [Gammaproteobacteria bacterium]|nr:hypothetical protein [Gammaproteobacteria bacterium]
MDSVMAYDQATGAPVGISSGIGQSSGVQQLAYTWEGFGNLTERQDANQSNLYEKLTYDDLNRLSTSTVTNSANNGPTNDYVYDAMGNITTPTIAGTSETYNYDPNHPYAVDTVKNSSGTTLYSASYDADGNMTTRNGYALTWTVDNLPESIASAAGSSTFSYGPEDQRYAQSATFNGNTTATAYIGGLFEVVSTATDTEYRHNIIADGQIVAVHTIDQSGSAYTDYLHYDHLGSVDAITNDSGNVIQAMSFDAFGQRRDTTNWDYDLSQNQIATLKNYTDRGYTDQEQLDNLSLVDLNGRVYDPTVGRMISADPTVPDPMYSQAFNRFAYVYDSPLVYVDPSGYETALDCPKPDAVNIGGSVTRTELGPVHVSCPSPGGPTGGGGGASPSGPTGPNPNPGKNPNTGKNPNNNPKQPPQPAQPCLKGPPVSATKTGIDQVQYTDAAGDTETLSGGSRSYVTNNPDNIGFPFASSHGSIGSYSGGGYTTAIFPSYTAGYNAGGALWQTSTYQNSPTLLSAINTWTGQSPPYTASSPYVTTMVGNLPGATAATPPVNFSASQLASAQQSSEGWATGQVTCNKSGGS